MDVFVGSLMSAPVHTISPETSVREAARRMRDNEIGSVVVVDGDGHLEGVLTATDFVHLVAEGVDADDRPVREHMSTDVVTTTANADIRDVADLLLKHGFHHVPVVDDHEGVVGMITTTDLTAYLSHVETPSPS